METLESWAKQLDRVEQNNELGCPQEFFPPFTSADNLKLENVNQATFSNRSRGRPRTAQQGNLT